MPSKGEFTARDFQFLKGISDSEIPEAIQTMEESGLIPNTKILCEESTMLPIEFAIDDNNPAVFQYFWDKNYFTNLTNTEKQEVLSTIIVSNYYEPYEETVIKIITPLKPELVLETFISDELTRRINTTYSRDYVQKIRETYLLAVQLITTKLDPDKPETQMDFKPNSLAKLLSIVIYPAYNTKEPDTILEAILLLCSRFTNHIANGYKQDFLYHVSTSENLLNKLFSYQKMDYYRLLLVSEHSEHIPIGRIKEYWSNPKIDSPGKNSLIQIFSPNA